MCTAQPRFDRVISPSTRRSATIPHTLHYALKANSTLGSRGLLRSLGGAADANSIWEIEAARKAGFQPSEIVFTGVGKSTAELGCGVALGLKAINVESAGELARIEAIAGRTGRNARVAIRVNPDIDAKSHPHISTGLKINKFGVPLDTAHELFASMPERRALKLVAIHVHVGSQITTLEPLRRAAARAAGLSAEVKSLGVTLEYLDLGGGLGISYDGREVPSASDYANALVKPRSAAQGCRRRRAGRTHCGPGRRARYARGRSQAADRRERLRRHRCRHDRTQLRPALYGAFHRIEPVNPRDTPEQA